MEVLGDTVWLEVIVPFEYDVVRQRVITSVVCEEEFAPCVMVMAGVQVSEEMVLVEVCTLGITWKYAYTDWFHRSSARIVYVPTGKETSLQYCAVGRIYPGRQKKDSWLPIVCGDYLEKRELG